MKLQIINNEKPPIYDAIIQNGMHPSSRVVYTYGDKLYNPSGESIPEDLIVHEETHMWQQASLLPPQERTVDNLKKGADLWWGRYLLDPYFRIDQEVEAYANQYAYICGRIKDRNQRNRILTNIGITLGGPIYGSVITPRAAILMVKEKAKGLIQQ